MISVHKTTSRGFITPLLILFPILLFLLAGCGGFEGLGNFGFSSSDFSSGSPGGGSLGNSVTLSWAQPVTNEDGSSLTDLAGYKVYYGNESGEYTDLIDVGDATSCTIGEIPSGTCFFTVTAYDVSGNESSFSNEVSKTF